MNILDRIDKIPLIVRAGVCLGIGIVGMAYLRNSPTPKSDYNPVIVQTSNYTLTDADRDGDVDSIKVPNKPRAYVTPEMVPWFKNNGDTMIDFMYQPPAITAAMQKEADLVLNGQKDDSRLIELLK
ncbi:MAG: hypothetical protein Q7R87_00255 [Nanoarchaeota archaeon]|nr:hypothetical protein [Nanoarchaeota archaeon]